MSQHSTHSFADKDSHPSSSLSYYSTYSSDDSQSRSHSPDPEANAEHLLHQAQSSSNVDSTSFLGSVWNLVKDAKELAIKELDRLLDNFPYKHQANNTSEVIKHDPLRVKKHKVSVTTRQPAKSLLGHGPHTANRLAIARKRTLAKRLLANGARDYLQDLSTMGNAIATSSRASPVEDSSNFVQFHRSNSLPIIPRKRHAPSYPSHPSPILSASVRSPAMSYRAVPAEESDGWESPRTIKDEESDTSELQLGRQQKRRSRIESRAGSETPSVVSLAGAMSISEDPLHHHRQHQPHYHSRHSAQHKRHHTENTSRALHRDRQHTSERGYEPGHEILRPRTRHQTERSIDAESIYPRSTSRRGSFSGLEDRLPPGQALLATNGYDPSTSGRSSPYSPFDTREDPASRPPSQSSVSAPSTVDNERFNKLQQELAAIKEQLASLVSARKEDMQRAQNPGSPPPPPPPPSFSALSTPGLISAKKWSIPQHEATVSMQKVLKELSSSTMRLRKTGSPFLKESRPSTASITTAIAIDSVNTTPTSKTMGIESPYPKTPTRIRRAQNTTATPLSSLSITSTPKGKDLSVMSAADVELRWPSPATIQRADAKLDTAAAAMNNRSSLNSRTDLGSVMTNDPEADPELRSLSSAPSNDNKRKLSDSASGSASALPRSGPVMDESQRKQRPIRPRSVLQRSLTDPTMVSQAEDQHLPKSGGKQVSFTASNSDKQADERKWYLESDTDGWRVGN